MSPTGPTPLSAPLPLEVAISLFARADDNRPRLWSGPWEAFAQETVEQKHRIVQEDGKAAKTACPMFAPARFHGLRAAVNVQHLTMAVFDYDHVTDVQMGQAVVAALGFGWSVLTYTAWSHAPENVSMRLVAPLSRPALGSEWPSLWARLRTLLGGLADPACKNADRGYFLPATHVTRESYAQVHYWPGQAIDVDAVLDLPMPAEVIVAAAGHGTQRISVAELRALHQRLRRTEPAMGIALGHVLAGEPFAEPGTRDTTLYRLCGELAKAFPEAAPEHIAAHFERSVSQWTDLTIQDVHDKISRRLLEHATIKAVAESAQVEAAKAKILDATGGARSTPYSQQEVDQEIAGADGRPPEPGLPFRWVIQKGRAFWFYALGEGYRGPFIDAEATRAAHTYMAPTTGVGVRLTELTDNGRTRHRLISELTQDYGQVACNVVYDLNAQRSKWEPGSATLRLAPCPRRDLEPAWHPQINHWLKTLAGDQYEHLERWIAYLVHTDRPLTALFLEGPGNAGKSLLANGLSRIWTPYGPSQLAELMSQYNAGAMRCPLAFADEIMPKELRGRTAELRELIQSRVRPYTQKYHPSSTVEGCFRIMVSANNRSILEGEDTLTNSDVAAIAGRLLHVVIPEHQAWWQAFFATLDTSQWVSGDLIARHALALSRMHPLVGKMPRFLIDPPTAELSRTIATSTVAGSAVAHWLVSFLLNPTKLHANKPLTDSSHLVLVRGGQLYASGRAIVEYWDTYQTNLDRNKATLRTVSKGLGAVSEGSCRLLVNAGRPRLFAVRTADLVAWAEQTGMATPEEITAALQRETAGAPTVRPAGAN